jgi:hypothetical protein
MRRSRCSALESTFLIIENLNVGLVAVRIDHVIFSGVDMGEAKIVQQVRIVSDCYDDRALVGQNEISSFAGSNAWLVCAFT